MKLSPEDLETILELRFKYSMTIREIAKRFDVTPRRIQQVLATRSIKTPGRQRKKLPPEVEDRIRKEYLAGRGIPTIHRTLLEEGHDISKYIIWRFLKEEGILRTRKHRNTKREEMPHYFLSFFSHKKHRDRYSKALFLTVLYIPYPNSKKRIVTILSIDHNNCLSVEFFRTGPFTLKDVINAIDSIASTKTFIFITRVPPLSPTRGADNKLTKHLKNLGINYTWVTSKGLSEKFTKQVMSKNAFNNPHLLFKKPWNSTIKSLCISYVSNTKKGVEMDESD